MHDHFARISLEIEVCDHASFESEAPILIEFTIKSASDGGFEFLFSCLS